MVSEVDSLDFFVAANGKRNPRRELERFVELLNSERGQEFVCRFPLRYRWLKAQVPNQWTFTTDPCEIYNSFVNKLDAKNLSLVFSSFYINNPGSTFGHTFLRVSRYQNFRSNELLDYAVNFAAQETRDNVFLYMLKGLGGFYPGRFSVVPYYYKIREYNDHEFRDIWDYDLGLSAEQIRRVVDHVWELGAVHYDYYYFTENCSYHILGLLNVAYDEVDLLKGLSPFYVLPIDTVKVMQELGLVRDRKVRASAYRRLLKETVKLTQSELELVKASALNPEMLKNKLQDMNTKKGAQFLDATISAMDYLRAEQILLGETQATQARQELLVLRAENPEISTDPEINERSLPAPDDAHDSSRLGVSGGYRDRHGAFSGIDWRAAQHDLLDPSQGQLKYAQVVMFDARLRFQNTDFHERKVTLDRFRLIDLKKYQPSDFWNNSIAFDLAVGLDQRRDCSSQDCLNPVVTFGVGNSTGMNEDLILTFLLGGSYKFDRVNERDSWLELGPKMNFLVLKDEFSLGADVSYYLPSELLSSWHRRQITYDLETRYFLNPNRGLFFKGQYLDRDRAHHGEVSLGVYFYH